MKTIVIVDPFSTGKLYAPLFNARGFQCVAVISRPDLPAHFTDDLVPQDFKHILHWTEGALDELIDLDISAVIAGCETAIHLTDALNGTLGLKGNSAATSELRRNKFAMQQALVDHGLAHIHSSILTSQVDISALLATIDPARTYVIKPLNSAATQGVVFAQGPEQVSSALNSAGWGQRNDLGEVNQGFIVQPFISGPEYVVDMVAFNGSYVIASVCKYTKILKNGSPFVYESLDTLDPADEQLSPLIDYARKAAAALEIKVGPIHMEIIWSQSGPVMIEAGARLHGGIAPQLFENVYAPSLVTLAMQSYQGEPAPLASSRQIRHGRIGFFCADQATAFKAPSTAVLNAAANDVAYGGHKYFVKPDANTPVTIDFATCPGLFWLSHPQAAQLDASTDTLRSLLWRQ